MLRWHVNWIFFSRHKVSVRFLRSEVAPTPLSWTSVASYRTLTTTSPWSESELDKNASEQEGLGSPRIHQHKKNQHILTENQHNFCPKRSCINNGSFFANSIKACAKWVWTHKKWVSTPSNWVSTLFGRVSTPPKWVSSCAKWVSTPQKWSQHLWRIHKSLYILIFRKKINTCTRYRKKKLSTPCFFFFFTGRPTVSCVMWCCPQHDNTMTMLTLNTRTGWTVDYDASTGSSRCAVEDNATSQILSRTALVRKMFLYASTSPLGHLRNHLADVPLQPHSPLDRQYHTTHTHTPQTQTQTHTHHTHTHPPPQHITQRNAPQDTSQPPHRNTTPLPPPGSRKKDAQPPRVKTAQFAPLLPSLEVAAVSQAKSPDSSPQATSNLSWVIVNATEGGMEVRCGVVWCSVACCCIVVFYVTWCVCRPVVVCAWRLTQ